MFTAHEMKLSFTNRPPRQGRGEKGCMSFLRGLRRVSVIAVAAACAVVAARPTAGQRAEPGAIEAELRLPDGVAVRSATAVLREARHISSGDGRRLDIGMFSVEHAGVIENGRARFENLPVPGSYDLRFILDDGSVVQGWNARVPPSDYAGDPPLEDEAREEILRKQASDQFTAFGDEVRVLDIRGNIQNAALLVMLLRKRPFVGGDYQPGEWILRVDRYQWEDPMEHTWVPCRKRPFYALMRERLFSEDYHAMRIAYARHLGGLELSPGRAELSLGTVVIPHPPPGIAAVSPDGAPIDPVIIKGAGNRLQ